jgi:hypothetical protein
VLTVTTVLCTFAIAKYSLCGVGVRGDRCVTGHWRGGKVRVGIVFQAVGHDQGGETHEMRDEYRILSEVSGMPPPKHSPKKR